MLNKNARPMAIRRKPVAVKSRRRMPGEVHPVLHWALIGMGAALFAVFLLTIMYAPLFIYEFIQELK